MRKILLAAGILFSGVCYGQIDWPFGNDSRLTDTFPPKYDTVKCIAVYLDGLVVKADSCLKISVATKYRREWPNQPIEQAVLAVYIAPKYVPYFNLYRIVLSTKKELPIISLIQFM
jgi:hypothetical protein